MDIFVSACRIGSRCGTASFCPKVALLHGSPSIIAWLHNDRVYGMADEWGEIEYHSSYVLRNELEYGETIPFHRNLKNETSLRESIAFFADRQLE